MGEMPNTNFRHNLPDRVHLITTVLFNTSKARPSPAFIGKNQALESNITDCAVIVNFYVLLAEYGAAGKTCP